MTIALSLTCLPGFPLSSLSNRQRVRTNYISLSLCLSTEHYDSHEFQFFMHPSRPLHCTCQFTNFISCNPLKGFLIFFLATVLTKCVGPPLIYKQFVPHGNIINTYLFCSWFWLDPFLQNVLTRIFFNSVNDNPVPSYTLNVSCRTSKALF